MAYLGQGPFQEFSNPPTKDSFTGDGSTVVFDMDQEVPSGSQNALEVFVDNVRQEPGTGKAFILGVDGSGDHKRITFSTAPANGAVIYVINDKTNSTIVAPLSNDLNGTELILDVDGDTSITADTDDRIDFKIANTDHISIGTSSGDTIIKPMVDAKDIMFQQYDGRDVLEINDAGYVALHNGTTGPGQLRIYEDDDNGANFTAFQVGTQAADITYTLPTADGSSGQLLTTNGSGVLSFSTVSSAADDLTIGDAAVLLSTSAGNITIDAAGNDTDIIFKGTDGGSDRVFMTIDGSAGGDLFLTGGLIDLKNDGSAVSQIKFYCESSNAHAQTLIGAPHSESATNTLTLPDGSNGVLLSTVSTATVTNKTFTSPKINEDVAVTTTATELNIIDGGTSASSVTVADADRVVFNDGGTMKQVAVTDLAAYFDDEITAMPNLVTTAATTVGVLGSGSIAAGFGNIDNGASNITSGGLVSLDVDADADDVTGDSATGRLTLGAGQDLNLYHGGTNSYIVNDTGDLILKTGASDEDMIFQGNDGGSAITALTLDMSAAGAATFNSTVAATGFIIGSANIGEAELEILDGLAATTAELTVIDGDTSATGTTVADADRVVMNDNGTMVQVAVTDLAAYFDDEITAMPNLITVGASETASSIAGIPFFKQSNSFYTHDVSATNDSANRNTAYGVTALDAITTGDDNVAMGYDAMTANTTGSENTALGAYSLTTNTTGINNTAVGQSALNANTTGGHNIGIGANAGYANTTGTRNIAIGSNAYDLSDTENDNMAIGYNAMTTDTAGGTANLAIGNYALDALTSGDYNVGVGMNALSALTTGGYSTALGYDALSSMTTSGYNVAVGYEAMKQGTTGAHNVAVGKAALSANNGGAQNTALGHRSMETNTSSNDNTAVGYMSLHANTTGAGNVAVGRDALLVNSTGTENVAVGLNALKAATTATGNQAFGFKALETVATGNDNTAVGAFALQLNTASNNTAVGYKAMDANTTGADNVGIGLQALGSNTTGTRNLAIGSAAYGSSDTENDNIAIGFNAMTTNTAGGTLNIAIGNYAMDALTSGDSNVAVGPSSQGSLTTGSANVSMGEDSLFTNTTGGKNTAIGHDTLRLSTTGSENVALGAFALQANTTGSTNVALGDEALNANTTSANSVAVGSQALKANTGAANIAIGRKAATANTSGVRNIAIGFEAYDASDTENDNIAIGYQAMTTNTAGGTNNLAIGNYALDALTSADHCIGIGDNAGGAITTGANNVVVGSGAGDAIVGGANNTSLGTSAGGGVSGGNDNVCLGVETGNYGVVLTTGSRNILIGNYAHGPDAASADAIVLGYNVGGANSTLSFGNATTDSRIAFGATSISAPSDIRLKRNIKDDVAGLSFINDLRPVTYEWKKEKDIPSDLIAHVADSEKTFNNDFVNHGFIAQEVKEVIDNHSEVKDGFKMWFEDDVDGRQRIAEGALVPMLVKAVQELSAKNDALLARIETLEG